MDLNDAFDCLLIEILKWLVHFVATRLLPERHSPGNTQALGSGCC